MLIAIGRRAKSEGLVDLLLECHQRIRSFVQVAQHIGQRDDAPEQEVIEACQSCARYFNEALPLHVADEELSLLPRMLALRPDLSNVLDTMHTQHEEHAPLLRALLDTLTTVQRAPGEALARAQLLSVANALALEFERHLTFEEQQLFPAIRSDMPESVQAIVIDELRARRRDVASPPP